MSPQMMQLLLDVNCSHLMILHVVSESLVDNWKVTNQPQTNFDSFPLEANCSRSGFWLVETRKATDSLRCNDPIRLHSYRSEEALTLAQGAAESEEPDEAAEDSGAHQCVRSRGEGHRVGGARLVHVGVEAQPQGQTQHGQSRHLGNVGQFQQHSPGGRAPKRSLIGSSVAIQHDVSSSFPRARLLSLRPRCELFKNVSRKRAPIGNPIKLLIKRIGCLKKRDWTIWSDLTVVESSLILQDGDDERTAVENKQSSLNRWVRSKKKSTNISQTTGSEQTSNQVRIAGHYGRTEPKRKKKPRQAKTGQKRSTRYFSASFFSFFFCWCLNLISSAAISPAPAVKRKKNKTRAPRP